MSQIQRTPLLLEITLRNLLSFGPDMPALKLTNLNVLVGPNGSGKSNLIAGIALLRSMTGEWRDVLAKGGGSREWIWKGKPDDPAEISATIGGIVVMPSDDSTTLVHAITLGPRFDPNRLEIQAENVSVGSAEGSLSFRYRNDLGITAVMYRADGTLQDVSKNIDANASILAQWRDPMNAPEITLLEKVYKQIQLYREWTFGRHSVCRQPQRADERSDRLAEDFSNLGMFLNRLRRNPKAKAAVLAGLRDLYEGLTDFDVSVEGGTVQVFFTEGEFTIPATRLSDGTIRYLCLLAILCDPEPPPLICIEEPELGMHPDLIPKIADLLVDASMRTQLIVTTHSDILVDALTETPECIIVCEKHNGQTEMTRLNPDDLKVWLENYSLGTLWIKGQLGGKRW